MNSTLNSLPSLYQLIQIPCFQLDTESQYQQTPNQMFNARRCWHSVNTWNAAIIFEISATIFEWGDTAQLISAQSSIGKENLREIYLTINSALCLLVAKHR